MLNFDLIEKGFEQVRYQNLSINSQKISHVISHLITKPHSLFPFTSSVISQYMYCNCLLSKSWCHEF